MLIINLLSRFYVLFYKSSKYLLLLNCKLDFFLGIFFPCFFIVHVFAHVCHYNPSYLCYCFSRFSSPEKKCLSSVTKKEKKCNVIKTDFCRRLKPGRGSQGFLFFMPRTQFIFLGETRLKKTYAVSVNKHYSFTLNASVFFLEKIQLQLGFKSRIELYMCIEFRCEIRTAMRLT